MQKDPPECNFWGCRSQFSLNRLFPGTTSCGVILRSPAMYEESIYGQRYSTSSNFVTDFANPVNCRNNILAECAGI